MNATISLEDYLSDNNFYLLKSTGRGGRTQRVATR